MSTPYLSPGQRVVVLSLVLLLSVAGCVVEQGKVYVKDGKRYGVTSSHIWRGRWWNYYERGLSYAEGAFWPEAIADLHEAIKQRDADQRRTRTYGLHFIDYFPHRELGIVYYHLGRYADAIREIETSLSGVDTAKAKFYLNKARQGQLEQSKGDTAAPRLLVDHPPDRLLTNDFTVTVRGHAEDDTYVSAIAINGRAQFIELAEPRLAFHQEVTLQDGMNTIDVVAVDLLGKLARQRLAVTLDRHGPLVSIERVEPLGVPPQQRARLTGLLSDTSRVVRFVLAGRPVLLQPGKEWEFRQEVPLTPGTDSIPFEAEDAAGNVTRGAIALAPVEAAPPGIRKGQLPLPGLPRWAALAPDGVVSDLGILHAAPLQVAQSRDQHPPVIKLTGLALQQTTYHATIYLEGQVTDASSITTFTLNGESLWRRDSRQLFFGYIASLQSGENRFVLEATDQPGNTARHEIVVIRKVDEVKQLDVRLRASLMPLEKKGDASALADTVYDSLLTAFVNQGRFQLVERAQLDLILQELKLSPTDLVDPQTAAKIGKIAAAEGILIGTATETQKALEVFARFVDVQTTTILAAEDVYGEDLDLRAVRTLMEGLALKIRQRFPLVQGLVLKAEGKKIVVDLGNKQLKKYMKLIVFRDGEPIKHPLTGKLLGAPTQILAEAEVEAVFDDFSQGVLLQQKHPEDVKQLDKVITK